MVGSFAAAISVSLSLSLLLTRCWIRETTGNFRFYRHFIIHDIVLSLGCNAGLVSYRRRRVKRVSSFVVLVLLADPCTRLARSSAFRLKRLYKLRTLLLVARESWIDDNCVEGSFYHCNFETWIKQSIRTKIRVSEDS